MWSLYIAKIMGPTLAIIAIGILANLKKYQTLAEDFFKNFALCYITGFIIIVLGLVMVNAHNIWVLDWPVIITIFSWLALVKGAFFIIFPDAIAKFSFHILKNNWVYIVACVVYLILGIGLSLKGYALI